MSKKIFSLSIVLLTAFSLSAQDSSRTLNQVVVTATKFPLKQNETGKVLTVITQAMLQKSLGKSLSEVLNQQTGITINGANNPLGTNQTVYVRGASRSNTLILVDGIPVYDVSGETNGFDLDDISIYNIERIEILKGAQSTLYGSDAVAGVINIITKKSFSKPMAAHLDFSAGSYNTYKGAISAGGSTKDGQSYFISYNKIKSKGFSSAYDTTGSNNFDRDGYDQDAVLLNYGFKASSKMSVKLQAKYNNNRGDIDAGAFADDRNYTFRDQNAMAGAAIDYLLKKGKVRFQYNFNQVTRDYLDDSLPAGNSSIFQKGHYKGTSHFLEAYINQVLSKHIELTAGADYRAQSTGQQYESVSSYGPYASLPISADTAAARQVSAYASFILKNIGGFFTEIGGRWNNHSVYGNNYTYSFNPSYLINNKYKLFANISSGYRVPSLYQLYSEYGNKALNPESSTSYEAGVQYLSDNLMGRVLYFKRDIKNVFSFYTDPLTYASKYINSDKQKDHGIEAEFAVNYSDKWDISVNYAYVDGRIQTKDPGGKDTVYHNLSKRPKNVINVHLNYQPMKALHLALHLKSVGKSYEERYAAPPYILHNYYTLDLYSEYLFNHRIKVFADLQNITGQTYFDVTGFNTKRFNANAGFRIAL